jgi:hypothetical protein
MRNPIRTIVASTAGAVVLSAASLALPSWDWAEAGRTTPASSAFPDFGPTPVVPAKSSVRSSKRPAEAKRTQTPVRASGSPRASQKRVRGIPRASASRRFEIRATKKPTPKPVVTVKPPVVNVTTISGYSFCGSSVASAQVCIDQGKLTLYYPSGVPTLAGHNYNGWYWMDDLPIGRTVKIQSGSLAGTYVVYAHGTAARGSAGGTFPSAGYGAAVALQTCTATGTGFSFLRRV